MASSDHAASNSDTAAGGNKPMSNRLAEEKFGWTRWKTTEDKANTTEAPTRDQEEVSDDDVLLLAAADIYDKAVDTPVERDTAAASQADTAVAAAMVALTSADTAQLEECFEVISKCKHDIEQAFNLVKDDNTLAKKDTDLLLEALQAAQIKEQAFIDKMIEIAKSAAHTGNTEQTRLAGALLIRYQNHEVPVDTQLRKWKLHFAKMHRQVAQQPRNMPIYDPGVADVTPQSTNHVPDPWVRMQSLGTYTDDEATNTTPPPTATVRGAGISSCGCDTCQYRETKYRRSLDLLLQHADHVALASFQLQSEILKIKYDQPLTDGERAKVMNALRELEAHEQAFKRHLAHPEAQLVQMAKLIRFANRQLRSNSSDPGSFEDVSDDSTIDGQHYRHTMPHAQIMTAHTFQQSRPSGAAAPGAPSSQDIRWGPEPRTGRHSPARNNAPYSSGPRM